MKSSSPGTPPTLSPSASFGGAEPAAFRFSFERDGEPVSIEHSLRLPLADCVSLHELVFAVLEQHQIPVHHEERLLAELYEFVDGEAERADDARFDRLQTEFHSDFAQNKSQILLQLNKLNLLRRSDSAPKQQAGGEEMLQNFRQFYHELMHSGRLSESLVTLECAFARLMANVIQRHQAEMRELRDQQANEMERFVRLVGQSVSECDVNLLSSQHFAQTKQLVDRGQREIRESKAKQREEFVQWIYNVYLDRGNGELQPTLDRLQRFADSARPVATAGQPTDAQAEVLQESFTINLGAQLKCSHNLRLTTLSVLDLCRVEAEDLLQPHRMQAAMSLYSHPLTAIVLFVNGCPKEEPTGFQRQFAEICGACTEMHFAEFEEQLEKVALESRRLQQTEQLQAGDVYVTRHSNLSQVHLAYHVVSDESTSSAELNSRHPVILAVRNVLKSCYSHEVGTISLPLLLINEMTENITIQWCMKRAELVLKCVKGFMIEISSFSSGREDTKTIQFVVPKVRFPDKDPGQK